MKKAIFFIITFFILIQNKGQHLEIHQTHGKDFADFVHTNITPDVLISPASDFLIQRFSPNYFSIKCLPTDEIKIAGITFNPNNYNRTRQHYDTSLILTSISQKNDFKIEGLPADPRIFFIRWSPDGKYIAFANETSNALELWICQVRQKITWRIANISLNAIINQSPIIWQSDSKSFLVSATLTNREKPEITKSVYTPLVFNNTGTWGNLSSSANLIKSPNDEKLFEFYGQSQLYSVTIEGETKPIGQSALLLDAVPSPDGKYILVQMIRPPFSYTAPYLAFPRKVEVWENNGTLYRELFELPSTENIAIGMGALPKGPRNIGWRPDVPSTLFWFKTLDGGNPERKAALRDRLYFYATPFDGEGIGVIDFENRIYEIYWGNPTMAICDEEWLMSGEKRISWFNPSAISPVKQLIFSYNKQNTNPAEFFNNQQLCPA